MSAQPGQATRRWTLWADAAAGLIFAVALVVAWSGGRWMVAGARISLSAGRLLLAAVVVAAIRHAIVPWPTAFHRLVATVRSGLAGHGALAAVLPAWLASRPTVLLVGLVAALTIGFPPDARPPRISSDEVWNLPVRWDVAWYMSIAAEGYHWTGATDQQQNLNFFPALPLLMRGASVLGGSHLPLDVRLAWAGTLISLVAFLGALVYLYRLFVDDLGDERARAGVMLLAAYPFAVVYSAAYTESLYLAGAAGAFYHLRRGELARSAAWALLVGLTRPNGVILALPLAIAALRDQPKSTSRVRRLAVATLPVAGMLLYSAYGYARTGHPFVWADLQRGAWGRTFAGVSATVTGLSAAAAQWTALRSPAARGADALNAAGALFAMATIWPVWRRFGAEYGLFVAAGALLPLANGGVESMGRYSAVLFPGFFWIAAATTANTRAGVASAFAIAQGLIATLFFTWRPPF